MSAVPQAEEPVLIREDRDGICTLTMNRPKQMNLLTSEMIAALQGALDAVAQEKDVHVVVLAGAGKGFCAGHDLKEIRALGEKSKVEALFRRCARMMLSIQQLPQPVIARVQGAAAAAGCQLVAQCDLAVASDAAMFTTPGVTWGFFCSTPGVAVGRNIHRKHAMEMLLTGDLVDAARAMEWGLINRVVAGASLDEAVGELARKLAAKPRATLSEGKRAFYEQMDLSIERAYEMASRVITASFVHEEGREGMDAFIEKRDPNWKQ